MYVPFSSFFSLSLKSCLSLKVAASSLSSAWLPSSQHAGQLLSLMRRLSPVHADPESRGYKRWALKWARRGRGSAARMGGVGCADRPCYICACAAELRGQLGRRRQDGVARDAGDRERGRTRTPRAHQWGHGGISGAGAGGEPQLPLPASPQWVSEQDGSCVCSLAQPLAPTHLLSQRLAGRGRTSFCISLPLYPCSLVWL